MRSGSISSIASELEVISYGIVDLANARGLQPTASHYAGICSGRIIYDISSGTEYYIKTEDNWGRFGYFGLLDFPIFIGFRAILEEYLPIPNENFLPFDIRWFVNGSELAKYQFFLLGIYNSRTDYNFNPSIDNFKNLTASLLESYNLELNSPSLHPLPSEISYSGDIVVYGRKVVNSDNKLGLQYWLFFPYNDYDLNTVKLWHEGDWELVEIIFSGLDSSYTPEKVVCSQLFWHMEFNWVDAPKQGNKVKISVEKGSHASVPYGYNIYALSFHLSLI